MRFLHYGLLALAVAATGCAGDDGMDGAPGADGMDGNNGLDGANGAAGPTGSPGSSGTNSLISQTQVDAGVNCAFGGVRLDSGLDDNGNGTLDADEIDSTSFVCAPPSAFTLQLLHFADIDGNESTALNAVDEFSALVDAFRNDAALRNNTLVVSSGDNIIPGPRYFAAESSSVRAITGSNEPGHVDHLFMNAFGVAATALGNHDLDQGPGNLVDSIDSESFTLDDMGDMDPSNDVIVTFPGAQFPYLAANVDFSMESDIESEGLIGENGADVADLAGNFAGSATVEVGGETIGLVGVSTPELPTIASSGDLIVEGDITTIQTIADAIQPEIDALLSEGVDKIIVLSHLQQISFEKELATLVEGVDIIVAGGSNTRQGDSNDTLFTGDDAFEEAYPFETTNADGDPLLIVNVDGDYKYLGRLVVSFDNDGVLIPTSVDEAVSGSYASTMENVAAVGGTPIPEVVEVRDAVQAEIVVQFENVVGHTDVYLEGRRSKVRTEETNLGNLISDSAAWYVRNCDEFSATDAIVVLRNGGGIRAEIGNVTIDGSTEILEPPRNDGLDVEEGDVSEGQLSGTLRFDNGIVVFDVNGEELKTLLEHTFAATSAPGESPAATPGQFPQVSGISVGFDAGQPARETNEEGVETTAGSRVRDLWVDTNGDGDPDTALYTNGGPVDTPADTTVTLVTVNFLANGGDDYPFETLSTPNRRQVYTDVGFDDPDEEPTDVPDFPILANCDPGMNTTFSSTGGEQDALAEYFFEFFPNGDNGFNVEETAPADDRRIQDLSMGGSFVATIL